MTTGGATVADRPTEVATSDDAVGRVPEPSEDDVVGRLAALGQPLGLAAFGFAGVATAALVVPRVGGVLPPCPSLTLFGVYCPLCGGTRGIQALASGDLHAMVGYNALLPILVVLGLWGWASWTARRLGWERAPRIPYPRVVAATFAAMAVLYGVLRNLPMEPWSLLAP